MQHLRYVSRARPISEAIEEAEAVGDLTRRDRLQLVLDVRAFAAEQGLKVGGSYLQVSDTTGLATAYVVTAAHADRLQPYEWSYPVVGRIPYRGYFDRSEADAFAERLQSDGLDTYVVEASGYSTLGWFDDPLPSGLLELDEVSLADVVLHELVHQTLYVPGHIEFNETFATAVAGRMTIDFFERRDDPAAVKSAREHREVWLRQCAVADELADGLRAYFAASIGADREQLLAGRAAVYRDAWPRLVASGLVRGSSESQGAPGSADSPDSAGSQTEMGDAGVIRINNAVFLAMYRYRRSGGDLDAYVGAFASISEALARLEAELAQHDDPYGITASRPLPTAGVAPGVRCLQYSQVRRPGRGIMLNVESSVRRSPSQLAREDGFRT